MGDEPKTPLGEKLLAIRNRAIANGMQLKTEEEIMTNDKGPATAGAPTPDEVEKSLSNVACGVADYSDCEVLRAHIAAQQAEVERLRFAATNLLDNLHGLTKLQEVQHRAPTWMKAIENSADRLIAAINPEQKGG